MAELYRGFSTINGDFKSTKLVDLELIKRDILNHFAIRKGEKLMNPEFGSVVYDVLMDPLDETLKDLLLEEVTTILNYDKRVRVNQIVLDEYEHGLQIACSLTLVRTDQTENLVIRFDEEAGFV